MIRRHDTEVRTVLIVSEAVLAVLTLALLSYIRLGPDWPAAWTGMLGTPALVVILFAFVPAMWIMMLALQGMYDLRNRWSLASDARGVAMAAVLAALATFAFLFLLPPVPGQDPSRGVAVFLFPILAVATIAERATLGLLFRRLRRRGRNLRNIVIVGTGREGQAFAELIESRWDLGLHVEGFLGDPPAGMPARWEYLGPVGALPSVVANRVVDEVALCIPFQEWDEAASVTAFCAEVGKTLRIPIESATMPAGRGMVEVLDGVAVLSIVSGPQRLVALATKRVIDIVGSAVGLLILSPILLGVAFLILVREGRPVVFRQVRAGLHGRPFSVWKFRTMERDADARRAELRAYNEVSGNASFKMTDDPRITPLGRWLRRTSIDELPQLWNVLRGEMSLVGPRPHPLDDVAGYADWHRRRLSMKPGVTGLWQIGARSDPDFDHWVEKDLEYIDHWSVWLDLRVLLLTIPALIRAEGR
jgi:exopolysaccharide biosynthesis polyprenyl glycosylphosphotransferase